MKIECLLLRQCLIIVKIIFCRSIYSQLIQIEIIQNSRLRKYNSNHIFNFEGYIRKKTSPRDLYKMRKWNCKEIQCMTNDRAVGYHGIPKHNILNWSVLKHIISLEMLYSQLKFLSDVNRNISIYKSIFYQLIANINRKLISNPICSLI